MLALPGRNGVNDSVRRVRVLVSRRVKTADQTLDLRLRPAGEELFRFHPVAAATGFHHERHAELDGIFHGVHHKVSCGVQRFCGHFEDEFVMHLQEQAGRNPLAQKQRL